MFNRRTVFVAGALALEIALLAGTATAAPDNTASQKIYLDPQTGDVMTDPPKQVRDTRAAQRKARTESANNRKAWVNDEGADMVTPDPGAAPNIDAVRCPDGSLRIGHAGTSVGKDPREALCADKEQ